MVEDNRHEVTSVSVCKRDRDRLVARVAEIERGVEAELQESVLASKRAVERNARRLNITKDKWTFLKLNLKSITKKATKAFTEESLLHQTLTDTSTQIARVLRKEVESKQPEWIKALADAEFVVIQFKHSAKTGWRAKVKEILQVARLYALQNFGTSEFTLRLTDTIRDLNAFSPEELKARIRELVVETENVDLIWGARARVLRNHEEEIAASSIAHKRKVSNLAAATRGKRKPLLDQMGAYHQHGVVVSSKSKLIGPESSDSSETILHHQTSLKAAANFHSTRECRKQQRLAYNRLLAEYSGNGQFERALETLNSMTEQNVHLDENVYKMVFGSCKRAEHNQAHVIYDLLKRLQQSGIAPSVSLCNIALGALIKRSLWRVAARILCLMRESGVDTNTATYEILMQVCDRAKPGDSPFIYDAFKHAGVPEAIAYACARRK